MKSFQKIVNISGWLVFAIAMIVYLFSAERSGSLWDCGEFILGAYKLQVVHPPGAAFFLLVGRIFAFFGDIFSSNPENIAFAVNLMSGVCTAAAAMMVCWATIMLTKLALVGREGELDQDQQWISAGSGVVAGLTTAFCTSVWFSAVEGEVYAMSTFFTALTTWSVIKWYYLPDTPKTDHWLLFALFAAGLSIGVHLLSLLTFPALALFYYFKKYKKHNLVGMLTASAAGVAIIVAVQFFIITGIPNLWAKLELFMVNSLGLPFHSGIVPTVLIVAGLLYFGNHIAKKRNSQLIQNITVGALLVITGFSTIGVIMIRANAGTPVNMNAPTDAMRLLPYLNREQYGERSLFRGPHFDADPIGSDVTDRYGRVGDRYEIVERKVSYKWNKRDMMLFPRISHSDQGRRTLHRVWMEYLTGKKTGKPTMAYNLKFMWKYQMGWMYWRYFMWNFVGRQNIDQGYFPWDKSSGNWLSGIPFVDNIHLVNQSNIPESDKNHKARNTYYAIPLIFGLLGLFFHFKYRREEALAMMALFLITGLGIIFYTNQPPNEPRERDYVLVGSFFTFAMWIGMACAFLFRQLKERTSLSPKLSVPIAIGLVMLAPIIMGFENFDDHSRKNLKGARDFAANFLNSCDPNSIIFTYGDNDTYPLWYAQEVEGIRRDVRVVNLSLIAVDWYINSLRRKVNDSPPIKFNIPADAIRGFQRNQVFLHPQSKNQEMPLKDFVKFIGEDHPLPLQGGRQTESYLPTTRVFIPVDRNQAVGAGLISPGDSTYTPKIAFDLKKNLVSGSLIKGDIAVLDIIASNYLERPIYFAITCRDKSLLGLDDYLRLEGLGLKIVPTKNKSDATFGLAGKGTIDSDMIYERVMNDFTWGNFDKYELHVDDAFKPSLQAHRMIIMRAVRDLLTKGESEKALNLSDKYFESLPHRNIPYDYSVLPILNTYFATNEISRGKEHIMILAEEIADHLDFFYSLNPGDIEAGYQSEFQLNIQAMNELFRMSRGRDAQLEAELEAMLGSYRTSPIRD